MACFDERELRGEDEGEDVMDVEGRDEDEDEVKAPVLTKAILGKWQKAILQVRPIPIDSPTRHSLSGLG